MAYPSKLFITLALLTVFHPVIRSQVRDPDLFRATYDDAGLLIRQTADSLETLVGLMKQSGDLTEIQRAQINLIRSKIYLLDEMLTLSRMQEKVIPDTTSIANPLLMTARNYIVQSRPDEGIPLILAYLENVDKDSDSAIYAKIYLAEAYRQKQEYLKGIGIVNEILRNRDISAANNAFAANRLAALYNEIPSITGNKSDSVIKYSRRCIDISEKNHLHEYLAASQNELGFHYYNQGILDTANYLITVAAENFLELDMVPQAINTYINLARVNYSMGRKDDSKDILLKALDMGNVEHNRNLFLYIYSFLSMLHTESGDYRSALAYHNIAYDLLNQFYSDRIQQQINEMSARYDLQEKEARIREEEHKSKTYRLQMYYALVIIIILAILMLILIVLFRFKSNAYNTLVAHNLKAMELEKQVERCLMNLTDQDITNQAGAEGLHGELALKFEKFLAEEKPYLWSEVSLEEFCKKLNTNRTYLSNLINEKYHKGFYDLMFEYRIRAALEYLNNPTFKHLSVEGIGEMAGFKSNSNFHKRFKSLVGMTPNQFRERAPKVKKHLLT